ncbi:MAG: hypothetical protein HFI90_01105 [Clostridia bacterium]|nr:hypothetical protein [Clostridia bacterium]
MSGENVDNTASVGSGYIQKRRARKNGVQGRVILEPSVGDLLAFQKIGTVTEPFTKR